MFKSERTILILAVLIRFLVMPFFYHPDMKSQYFHFQFLSKGAFNIYDYLADNKKTLPYQDTFNYLPLTYYTFGIVNLINKPLLGDNFTAWINNWGEDQNRDPNIPYYLMVLKIPYLILDLSLGWLLYKLYKNKKLLIFWYFNPISIYLIYILGNFDILPTFLTFLSFYFLKKDKDNLSFLSLGLAIALKVYPVIFLPFLLFYKKNNLLTLIKNGTLSFLPLILTVLPFLFQKTFLDSFLGSGLTQKLLEYKLYGIPIFPLFYLLIFLNYVFSKSNLKFEKAVVFTFLIFIGLVNFHPQWIVWFFPFVIVFLVSNLRTSLFLSVFFALTFIYILLINDNYLFWGHLIPIDPNFLSITSPYQIIKLKTHLDPKSLQNQIHILLLMMAVFGTIFYAKKK